MCMLLLALAIIVLCLPNLEEHNVQSSLDLVWRIAVMLFGAIGIVLAFNRQETLDNQLTTSMKQLRETAEVSFQHRYAIGVGMLWENTGSTEKGVGGSIAGCKVLGNLGVQDKDMSIQCTQALVEVVGTRRGISPLSIHISSALSSFIRKWGNDGSYLDIKKLPGHFWSYPGKEVYFPNVDLKGTKLSNAQLNGACLSGSNFREANLENAKFSGADLRRADFREANLKGTNFTNADLRDANFSGNDLTETTCKNAKMKGADLEGTDTSDVRFDEANFD